MKETLRLILTVTIICSLAGALLAGVNSLTKERIQDVNRNKKLSAIQEVLPPCDNQPDANACVVEYGGRNWTFFVARNGGAFAGAAVETSSSAGYGGDISLMLGINAENKTQAIAILGQKETPGLGANIEGDDFKGLFAGKALATSNWAVAKDGGEIDQITAATISSRAVTEAVKAAIDAYLANEEAIEQTGGN
ncbi:MAG: RnfABCDGE type electron transport complex subunit G [Verrucomicrobia bacterium]|jgi:Na+-translocating ferredoxin:NAD+ oxidoreductase subunit G|nr:RnfABCDGE type electron transport complex subunit G [Verrucomicrobiota bacterium]